MRNTPFILPLIVSLTIAPMAMAQNKEGLNNDGSGRTSGAEHLDSKGRKQEQKSKVQIGGGAAQSLINAPVQGKGDKPAGKVESACLVNGEIHQLIVLMPRDAGGAEHRVALPFTEASVRTDKQPLVKTGKSVEELRQQPAYEYRNQNQVGKVFGSADAASVVSKATEEGDSGTCNTK